MQQPFITGKQPMCGGRSIFVLNTSQKTLQQYMDSIHFTDEEKERLLRVFNSLLEHHGVWKDILCEI